jgi:hypothetical protein
VAELRAYRFRSHGKRKWGTRSEPFKLIKKIFGINPAVVSSDEREPIAVEVGHI